MCVCVGWGGVGWVGGRVGGCVCGYRCAGIGVRV